ncbi:516_t:CDS:2, partial [Gigaspora margarita]
TIEYSANDYSISLVAKGKYDDYMKYKNRARSWENLWYSNKTFNGTKGFIIPRDRYGTFYTEIDVLETVGGNYVFYESTSWQYSLDIPFDVKRLIELSGGPKLFEERLDKTFSNNVDVIRDILRTNFGSGQDGIPGNDDSGAMGTGTDIYLINSPHFDQVTIKLSSDIAFTILAHNLTIEENHINPYVQCVKINGINWRKTWFRHSDIAKGAIMELFMGPKPSKVWGVIREDEDKFDIENRVVPPSMSSIESNDKYASYRVANY